MAKCNFSRVISYNNNYKLSKLVFLVKVFTLREKKLVFDFFGLRILIRNNTVRYVSDSAKVKRQISNYNFISFFTLFVQTSSLDSSFKSDASCFLFLLIDYPVRFFLQFPICEKNGGRIRNS